jgi:hypothetical protein
MTSPHHPDDASALCSHNRNHVALNLLSPQVRRTADNGSLLSFESNTAIEMASPRENN